MRAKFEATLLTNGKRDDSIQVFYEVKDVYLKTIQSHSTYYGYDPVSDYSQVNAGQ